MQGKLLFNRCPRHTWFIFRVLRHWFITIVEYSMFNLIEGVIFVNCEIKRKTSNIFKTVTILLQMVCSNLAKLKTMAIKLHMWPDGVLKGSQKPIGDQIETFWEPLGCCATSSGHQGYTVLAHVPLVVFGLYQTPLMSHSVKLSILLPKSIILL